jgi:hypothetical protein
MVSDAGPPELYIATEFAACFMVDGEIMGCHLDRHGKPQWDQTFTSWPTAEGFPLMVAINDFLTKQAIIRRNDAQKVRLVWRKE